MIYKNLPKDFNPEFDVAACFIEYEEKILVLLRQDSKPEGNKWCLPSGKVDKENKEQPLEAILREIKEETDLKLKKSDIKYRGLVYVRYSDFDFNFLTFQYSPKERPEITLNPAEHKDYKWISPKEALKLTLVQDFDACIKLYYKIK